MIAETVRDILLSVYLAAGIALTLVLIVAAFFVTKALLGLIRAAKRPLEGFGEVADATVEHIAKPLCLPTTHAPIFSKISRNALSVSLASASILFSSSTISAIGR